MAQWHTVLDIQRFTPANLEKWFLEGAAEVRVTDQGELLIENVKRQIGPQEVFRSTLWYREPIWGDLRFELEVRGEDRNGNIFFFNAQPLQGHKSIFEWARPQANYVDYTGDPRMQMYTLGILRSHQDQINLRYLGGTLAHLVDRSKADPSRSPDPDHQGMTAADFEAKTILHSVPSPFHDPDKYYRIELMALANRLQVRVDGREVLNYVDEDRAAEPLRGGYFAFRNFALTRTWCRFLRISRLA